MPLFLIAFLSLMTINSLFSLPQYILNIVNDVSRFALVVSIAAIGMKSNFKQLLQVGAKPILLILFETLWLAGFILLALAWL